MGLVRTFAHSHGRARASRKWRKNAAIVSRHADLDRAALGIVRSAFGLQGKSAPRVHASTSSNQWRTRCADGWRNLPVKFVSVTDAARELARSGHQSRRVRAL